MHFKRQSFKALSGWGYGGGIFPLVAELPNPRERFRSSLLFAFDLPVMIVIDDRPTPIPVRFKTYNPLSSVLRIATFGIRFFQFRYRSFYDFNWDVCPPRDRFVGHI